MVKTKASRWGFKPAVDLFVAESEEVEEEFLENGFVQALLSFIFASIVYFVELYFFSAGTVLASLGFLIAVAILLLAMRALWNPKRRARKRRR